MAHSAHNDPAMMEEHYDPDDVLVQKVDKLAAMVRESRHFVVFTGAGISTSAGIPDFRGPDGKWTRQAKGKEPLVGVQTVKAFPTPTHMALVDLHKRGVLKYVISQNCDGLHRRSGLPAAALSELHGNGNVEICEDCGRQYFRDIRCDRVKPKACDHFTGRFCKCKPCNGRLLNSTIDFGQDLPKRPLNKAREQSSTADLHLALGSSLTVSPANQMPMRTVQSGGKFVICNLQRTPVTEKADFQIFAKTDVVMTMLMERLQYPIPPFRLVRRVIFGVSAKEVYAKSVDVHDETVEVDQICAVDWDGKCVPKKVLRDPTAAAQGAHCNAVAGMDLRNLSPCLHFVGHYCEPPLRLAVDLSGSPPPKALGFLLTFNPYDQTWTSACQDLIPEYEPVDDARIPDYGRSHHEYCVQKVMQARDCSSEDAELVVKNRVMESMQASGCSRRDAEKVVETRMRKSREEAEQRQKNSATRRINVLLQIRKIQKENKRIQAEKDQPSLEDPSRFQEKT
eukprot:gnl/MRDRNA2_/MRDRNA2_101633_c0_seq1.p1 gnl/MRDRNA2_/MRDRNA2_101633_c0~~gnl/MRDRNA2_/MRDRNA2_101633_c0_seq1.p1  ORF type:complete len:533 (+),score=90.98 gnl/MRDRNA2_/MRDRNA2_101633_c0_seq1:75-1601(+)